METRWKKVNSLIYSQTAALQRLVCTSKSRFMPCFCRPLQLFATLKSNVIKASTRPENSPLIIFYRCLFFAPKVTEVPVTVVSAIYCFVAGDTNIHLHSDQQTISVLGSAQRPWFWLQKEAGGDKMEPMYRHRNVWIYKVLTEDCFFFTVTVQRHVLSTHFMSVHKTQAFSVNLYFSVHERNTMSRS